MEEDNIKAIKNWNNWVLLFNIFLQKYHKKFQKNYQLWSIVSKIEIYKYSYNLLFAKKIRFLLLSVPVIPNRFRWCITSSGTWSISVILSGSKSLRFSDHHSQLQRKSLSFGLKWENDNDREREREREIEEERVGEG